MQYEKVPRKTPNVHCVVRSLTKPTRMRGENWVEASVRVISRIANTIDTTVMIDVAMLLRMIWATPGSCCDGNRTVGIQRPTSVNDSSMDDSTAPAAPSTSAIARGRMRKPPRNAYRADRNSAGRRSNMLKGCRQWCVALPRPLCRKPIIISRRSGARLNSPVCGEASAGPRAMHRDRLSVRPVPSRRKSGPPGTGPQPPHDNVLGGSPAARQLVPLNRDLCESKRLLARLSFLARKRHPLANNGAPHIQLGHENLLPRVRRRDH